MATSNSVDIKAWIDQRPVGRYQWLILGLCFFIVLFDGVDVAVMGFIAPAVMQDWALSKAAFGPVMSAAMFGLAAGALLAGPFADRIGRKKVLLLAVTLFAVLSLACAFARNPYELAILRFFTGIGLGAAMPNTTTLLSEYLPQRLRSVLITVMFTGFNLGSGAGGFVAAWLLKHYDWHAVLLVGGLLPLALLPALWLWLPESARFLVVRRAPDEQVAKLMRPLGGVFPAGTRFTSEEPAIARRLPLATLFNERYRLGTWALWLAYFMGLMVIYLLMGWLPTLMRDAGIAVDEAARTTGLFQIGGAVGALLVGWLMDRHQANRVISLAYLGGALFIAVLGLIGLGSSALTLVVMLAGFCMSGAQTGLNAYAPGYYPTEARATGVSWMLGIGRFGAIFGSIIGGVVLGLGMGMDLLFITLALPAVIASLAILVNARAARRLSAHGPVTTV